MASILGSQKVNAVALIGSGKKKVKGLTVLLLSQQGHVLQRIINALVNKFAPAQIIACRQPVNLF